VKVISLVPDWLFSHSFASDVDTVVVTDALADAPPNVTPAWIVELTEIDILVLIVVV
jgi:hypothetical protein